MVRASFFLLLLVLAIAPLGAATLSYNVSVTVDASGTLTPISPYVYGSNSNLSGAENFSMLRQGGNRLTGYNWENNASNAGEDYLHSSDNYLAWIRGITNANEPGICVTSFIDSCRKHNQFSLITFQMAGYVARDKKGTVAENEVAPSPRWRTVVFKKEKAFSSVPDTADSAVYMDEQMNFLEKKYAAASDPWLGGISLDNEPALWPTTHPRIHPSKPTSRELLDKSIALSSAIKNIDAKPLVFGPVAFGYSELMNFQGASDWPTVKGNASWFVDWYLDEMKKASAKENKRLLDVFDLHWYSEARGNGERVVQAKSPAVRANAAARMQAPRTLWDKDYREDSWVAQSAPQFLPLIPKLKASIDKYYPGTKLGFTEYNYGGENHVSGGIAMADVLGIFGKYGVDFATYWKMDEKTDFTSAAFKLYRNYDGKNSSFGSQSVPVTATDSIRASTYASCASANYPTLHVIVLNKSFDSTMNLTLTISGSASYDRVRVWGFDSVSAVIVEKLPAPVIFRNTVQLTVPRLSACHVVCENTSSVYETTTRVSGNGFLIVKKTVLKFNFPDSRRRELAVYALNGTLIRRWDNLPAQGTVDLRGNWFANNNLLAVWRSGDQTYVKKIPVLR